MAFGVNQYPAYGQQYPYYQPQAATPPLMDNLTQMRSQQTQMPAQSGMVWVQGEAAAKAYLVAAGNTVPLWDSEAQTIYIKSVDQSGMPSMRIVDYSERTTAAPPAPAANGEYVTRKEYEELAAKVAALFTKEDTVNG